MDSTNNTIEVILQQGQNVLESTKDLKRSAKKKGKERSDLYEKFCANQHSFNVYTYIDPTIDQLAEIQLFQQKMELFREDFTGVLNNFEKEVNLQHIEKTYVEVFIAYDAMVNALGYPKKALNAKGY
ncbi:hypothetical protein R4Z09_20005 [Niallia oryzisoli]|uniref:Uncharacterized protein n=1 Tax=Niallia oryzisoli TaxID=1737571 RepID=A0ABZ2C870_9BACI